MIRIGQISFTPVKCMRLHHPESIELGHDGVTVNRRFALVDGEGNRLRSSLTSWPIVLTADYDPDEERLRITFPDGHVVEEDALGNGEALEFTYGNRPIPARVVHGAWEERLAEMAGHPVHIVRPDVHGSILEAPVTLISDGSLARLGQEAGSAVDGRRFRMLFTLTGCAAHEEDEWNGRQLQVGDAVLRAGGPVDRCAMTTRHPETGETDLDTLRLIKGYRGMSERKTIDFGVYADVVEAGAVRVGDELRVL